jgi:murein DD-endopeptidase MepM/ murein hydrolase activator NlpD
MRFNNRPAQAIFKNQSPTPFKLKRRVKKTPIAIIGLLATIFILFAFSSPSEKPEIKNLSQQLAIPTAPLLTFVDTLVEEPIQWQHVKVKKGQTLSSIFKELNLSQSLLYKIINIDKKSKSLTKIFPGAIISFDIQDNEFKQLKYNLTELEELIVKKEDEQYLTEIVQHPTEVQVQTSTGTITGSLFNAGKKAGLTDAMVMKLANIFAWDIDFILDIRQGDSFSLIYEKIYQNGEFLRDGKIVAASFTNQGKTYKAVAFDDGEGWSYYNPEGRNMKKAFLRAPLNFSYISSSFNPKRFHPVQKRVKAHRGIDYAAPRGTPVFAAGNGKVIKAGYNKYNGNYVFIQHNNGITTKYLHFTKRLAKKGQRVKQGQTIGTVGSTGMVTGAHLHYEFLLNGVHRNPRTVKLPKASPLAKNKIASFISYATPLISQLDSIDLNHIAQLQKNSSIGP